MTAVFSAGGKAISVLSATHNGKSRRMTRYDSDVIEIKVINSFVRDKFGLSAKYWTKSPISKGRYKYAVVARQNWTGSENVVINVTETPIKRR